ncbi:copper chaperone [Clydaea vesicula]|uniref:Copper chaperone n=1 Tax=Clydaea vesicula TaxID=447962 RepID=A0AAD5XY25_9FUNG|nr:copper chaperone [Clydaea vesicula]KAJ3393931.1 copper chaperone [Lobulomyces angularis]
MTKNELHYEIAFNKAKFLPLDGVELIKETSNTLQLKSIFHPTALLKKLDYLNPVIKSVSNNSINLNAVCIFEHFSGVKPGKWQQFDNKGLARFIQTEENVLILDLSMSGLKKNAEYSVMIFEAGDISSVPDSLGSCLKNLFTFKSTGDGELLIVKEIENLFIYDIIGRSLVVDEKNVGRNASSEAIAGIIARSAGFFQNEKMVCSCSGNTIWQEAKY